MNVDVEGARKAIVLGVGNILLGDEGIGVRVVQRLSAEYALPEELEVVDGGTAGIDLLPYFKKNVPLIIVDALKTKKGPGEIMILRDAEVPAFIAQKLSPHQIGLPEVLATSHLIDEMPDKLVLIGIEPQTMETGIELSPLLESKVEALIEIVIEELAVFGVSLRRKG